MKDWTYLTIRDNILLFFVRISKVLRKSVFQETSDNSIFNEGAFSINLWYWYLHFFIEY
jgi:hypothetical protein